MISKYLSLIKFSHTIFAMPFALVGYFLGVQSHGFSYLILIQVIVAMVLARSAAMGFNRLVDYRWDAKNPRTATREIPAGKLSVRAVTIFVAICSIGFCLTALWINTLCFALSPIALIIILGYSYTKRFTSLAHIVLGLALSIAPIGAYIAVTGTFALLPALFMPLVLCWVAGFDIIFALQDREFDREQGLHSIPVRFGIKGALTISAILHALSALSAIAIGLLLDGNMALYWSGAAIFIALLSYEHIVVTPSKLHNINLAFATINSYASVIYGVLTILSITLH